MGIIHYKKTLKSITSFHLSVLLSLSLSSQDLSEDFLKSLPIDAQNRIKLSNDNSSDNDLDVLLNAKSSVEKNEALLKNLSRQIEILQESMGITQDDDYQLDRFGDSFFKDFQSTFMPVNVANLGDDYLVDIGDQLKINLFGKINDQEEVMVARDGSITIASLGKIIVAGKSFNEVENQFNAFLESNSLGIEGSISLSKLRDMQVLVLGYTFQPGIYTLAGGSSIIGALKAAGGIDPNGSFRDISHIRNGEVIKKIDLYDLLINGIFDISMRLKSGDSILVNPIKKSIPISGGVNRPAIYELLEEENISHLIHFAGGISQSSSGYDYVNLRRHNLESFSQTRINLSEIGGFSLQSRDQVEVPFYQIEVNSAKKVSLEGWVQRPGTYFLDEGDTYEDLIKRAGGLKDGAYTYGITLLRKTAIQKEEEFRTLEYTKSLNFLVTAIGRPGTLIPSNALEMLEEEMTASEPVGRIINDFVLNKEISLMDGDRIIVPKLEKTVYLFGEFNKSSNAFYDSDLTIEDYIAIGGGLTANSTQQLVIIDPDGKSSVYNKKQFLKSLSLNNINIYPGSIVYAPRDIGKLSGIQYASTVAPILSSLALSLASINSINN